MDAAKLEALEGLVREVDDDGPPSAEAQQQRQAEDQADAGARDWAMVAFVIGNGLSMIAPELKPVYNEDACLAWGRSMNPVADKYGWNSPSAAPEFGLLVATLGLGVPSFLAIRQRMRELKADQRRDELRGTRPSTSTVDAETVPASNGS